MVNERMQIAIEYKNLLLEILDLEEKIFGDEELPEAKPIVPIVEKKEPEKKPEKKAVKKVAVDKGKILALAKAGWKKADIARDVKCSEATVYAVLKEAKEDGQTRN